MLEEHLKEGLTFDDVLILPAKSEILPTETDVSGRLTRRLPIKTPIINSTMDTVPLPWLSVVAQREDSALFTGTCQLKLRPKKWIKLKGTKAG